MTAGYCHEDPRVVAERGTELVGWYIEQQRERARLVWRDYDPTTVPPDYQGYYARDQRLAAGPHPGEPTPQEVREQGTSFCVGTPAECIRFLELYEALGIEEVILLCAIGPAQHDEVLHTTSPVRRAGDPALQVAGPPGRLSRIVRYMCCPPLIDSVDPVMNSASSAVRKATPRAMSIALPSRPTGMRATIFSSTSRRHGAHHVGVHVARRDRVAP